MLQTIFNKETKQWHGGSDFAHLYDTNTSLAQVLLDSLSRFGSKTAQISDNNGIRMSFDEIHVKTLRAAQNLQARGYDAKQVFGLLARNSQYVAPIVFASISIGCPINTMDPAFGKVELIHMLKTTNPVLMCCDIECFDLLQECLEELGSDAKIFTFGGNKSDSRAVENLFLETGNEAKFVPVKVDASNDTAIIICSSGTTGLSKGVCLSHAALVDAMSRFVRVDLSDVLLGFSSLYWLSGIIILLKGTMSGSTRIITNEVFRPELQLKMIEQYKVTLTINASHHLVLMMKSEELERTDLSSLKHLIVGGCKVPLQVRIQMNKYLPNGNIHAAYGLSETAGLVSFDYPEPSEFDTAGKLVSGVNMKIVDDQGNRCGINTDGEICIKWTYKFLGYYNNQEATDEFFDEEGFILTGDIGHFDENGYLNIVDRKKDLIKYCNYPISPSEIDSYLVECSHIKSACVVGIPNVEFNELPAAVIVRASGSNISEREVFDMVAARFADYCKLRGGVYFVDSLPVTPSGKVLRRKVKEIALYHFDASRT